jgi:lysophospholipase L1-like esterase
MESGSITLSTGSLFDRLLYRPITSRLALVLGLFETPYEALFEGGSNAPPLTVFGSSLQVGAKFFHPEYHGAMNVWPHARRQDSRGAVLAAIRKCGRGLLGVPLVVLFPFGALLVSGCSAEEGVEDTWEETTTATGTAAVWNYVALGDSLAAGTGASYEGYVNRFAAYLEADTGAQVNVTNLGRNGQTSSELLHALRNDPSWRRAVGEAYVLTVNIGLNDLGRAAATYENGTCGGADNQDCLREVVSTVEGNWNAIFAELLSLRSTNDTIIRTAGLGYTPYLDPEGAAYGGSSGELNALQIFEPYLDEVNRHLATMASDNGIPYAEVRLDGGYISQDRVHPNDEGYEVIAGRLRELGYNPFM